MKIIQIIGWLLNLITRAMQYCIKCYQMNQIQHGTNVWIGKNCTFSKSVKIGNDVSIGQGCIFTSTSGKIEIGNHIMFGPGVHIHGGNHKIKELGRYMKDATPKTPDEDGVVEIEDDCWIGAMSIILKGVHIGKGSVIGAGSVVTHDIPPYSIYVGVTSPRLRARFSQDQIKEHERKIKIRYAKEKSNDNVSS